MATCVAVTNAHFRLLLCGIRVRVRVTQVESTVDNIVIRCFVCICARVVSRLYVSHISRSQTPFKMTNRLQSLRDSDIILNIGRYVSS